MSLLLGETTSMGTLRDIASLVNAADTKNGKMNAM